MKFLLFLCPFLAMASFPKEAKVPSRALTTREAWWRDAQPRAEDVFRIEKAVNLYRTTAGRYQAVSDLRGGTCPPPVIFTLHMRESTWSFRKHLHEGSSLSGRTRWVPKGRPVIGSPPFTFEESAEDALFILKSYDERSKWQSIDSMLDWVERYNGTGYRRYHPEVPSPYVVAGSNLQVPGKYVADGKFSKTAMDQQLGCLIVLKEIVRKGYWSPPPY